MSVPQLIISPDTAIADDATALVLVVPANADASALAAWEGLQATLEAIDFTGAAGAYARIALPAVTALPVAVAGSGAGASADDIRSAVGAAVRSFTDTEHLDVHVVAAPEGTGEAAAEGAALGGYTFESYKKSGQTVRAQRVTLHTTETVDEQRVAEIAASVALVKDLTTTPAEWLSPAQLADAAVTAAEGLPLDVRVWDEQQLAADGFGGILGVGQGSERPPRLVRVEYAPEGASEHIALVGKGITYDTGGLSLKPAAGMLGMKDDMNGAAVVLAVVRAAAALGLNKRVTGWMCIADNMPSGRAIRPGDVLRMFDGQSVEVTNTDAEGRLVMADGLAAASAEHPDVIIDVATLTGAILVSLGTRHTGVFGHDAVTGRYLAAAAATDEPAWHMPMLEHLESELDSQIADMRNANMGSRFGGSSYAALFLQRFVGRTGEGDDAPRIPWAHLDIAGSAINDGAAYGFNDKGATGASVRSLIELLSR